VGQVVFKDFKVADNLLAGIEFESCLESTEIKIKSAIVVGKSTNTETSLDAASPRGIITPRTDYFKLDAASFINFNFNTAAALGSCSHCFNEATTDSGGRTSSVKGLTYTNVTKRINY
jgi:hypothetical protein